MSAINQGNQTITFDYKNIGTGDSFNKLLRNLIKPGIYKIASAITNSGNTISIPAFTAGLNVDTDKFIHVTTTSVVTQTAVEANGDVLVITYSWGDTAENWLDFQWRNAASDPYDNEVILCQVTYLGGVVNSIDLTVQTKGLFIDEDYNIIVDTSLSVGKNSNPSYTLDVAGTFNLTGAATLESTLDVTGATTLNSTLDVTGAATINSSLEIIGSSVVVCNSQTAFNSIIERTGANTYQFIDGIISITLNYLSGGYTLTLSGGDTWGKLETNECEELIFNGGAYIDVSALANYLEVNTNDCYLKNVDIIGDTTSTAISYSYVLNALRVTYDNCKTSVRNSTVDFVGFQGSGTLLHNVTSKYINCSVFTIDGADKIYGFKDCMNLGNCLSYDLDTTSGADHVFGYDSCKILNNCSAYTLDGGGSAYGFFDCYQMSTCNAYDIDGAATQGFGGCYQMSSCKAEAINSTTSGAQGFNGCYDVSGCYAYDIASTSSVARGFYQCEVVSSCRVIQVDSVGANKAYGFSNCNQISGCYVEDIDAVNEQAYGFYTCIQVSGCQAKDIDSIGAAYGFYACAQVSGCQAEDIDSVDSSAYGFVDCSRISACYAHGINTATTGAAAGFNNCDQISSCRAYVIASVSGSAWGFHNCEYGAALYTDEAANTGNDWIDTVDTNITNKVSTPSVWT